MQTEPEADTEELVGQFTQGPAWEVELLAPAHEPSHGRET